MKKILILCLFALSVNAFSLSDGVLGAFKLYSEPGYEPKGFCDRSTELKIDRAEMSGLVAFLKNQVEGRCRLFTNPNNHHYILSKTVDSCSSKIYKDSRYTMKGLYKIEITDHRTRLCEDLPPALLILKETSDNSESTLFAPYSW